jgi:hypothetical protein
MIATTTKYVASISTRLRTLTYIPETKERHQVLFKYEISFLLLILATNGKNIGDNLFLEEWKQARDVLKSFDDRIHDLRKYGFTFITGLMAVEGILLRGC